MATATVLNRKALQQTASEKARVAAGKSIVSVLTKGDAALLNEYVRSINTMVSVLNQEGDGQGKRFAGAGGHDFQSQANALGLILSKGNVPTFA